MATHSSILAWRIPWTEEPGGLQVMKSQTQLKQLSMHVSWKVHWDDPEGWDGEGGGRGVQDGEHM